LLEPVEAPSVDGPSDEQLVAAVRRGDDRAFEQLYRRYQRRIGAYVFGMVKDHGRAEDVTQEVFVSALRRMRQTERPIAFKPWVYEIAKNACIDAFRRTRRAEEVSFDAEEGLAPSDYGRLVGAGPTPVEAVTAKEDIDHLRGAFGGLSDMHHEILVMRELEGHSYREIGDRLGLSRPAVESTLFRARKRLTEEYDELVSGARCLRIQSIITNVGAGAVGVRDSRRLARHVAHCQPCRRLAAGAGFDIAALAPATRRERIAAKVAGWLPFPIPFLARRGAGGGGGAQAIAQLAASGGDPAVTGWAKMAIAAATMVFAAVGAGVGEHAVRSHHDAPTGSAASQGAASRLVRHDALLGTAAPARGTQATTRTVAVSSKRTTAKRDRVRRSGEGSGGGTGAAPGGGGANAPGGGGSSSTAPSSGSGGSGGAQTPKTPLGELPAGGSLPVSVPPDPVQTVSNTVNQAAGAAGQTVQGVGNAAGQTVQGVGNAAGQTVQDVGGAAGQAVGGPVGHSVQGATGAAGNAVNQVAGAAGNTVNQVTGGGTPHLP
jgi:RNA polymerase sigma factor (sigma-70 family)